MTTSSVPLRPAEDTIFFALDDGGILFSEARQDLHLLDAAASYVWCSLEDGIPSGDIATAYAEACGLTSVEANRLVGGLLHRWAGLGHLHGDGLPPAPVIDFTTALARLLVNPALRRSLATAPEETARRLGLREGDRDAFLRLDAAQLETQVLSMADQHRHLRRMRIMFDHEITRSLGRRVLRAPPAPPEAARCYRLCGTTLCLRFGRAAQHETVRLSLRHLELGDDSATPDLTLDVTDSGQGHAVLWNGELAGYCDSLDRLARVIIVLVRDLVLDRADYFLLLHAGVVGNGDGCALLPAAPGSGKSTLTAALAQSGLQYLTDEIAILEREAMRARPFPLPMVVKEGSVEPLRSYYPALPGMPVALRDNDQRVRYLPPPPGSAPPEDCLPVRWIVFPRYDAAAETALQPIPTGAALSRLMGECKVVAAALDRTNVAAMIAWLRQVECYDLTVSSLPAAVALMRGLCSPLA